MKFKHIPLIDVTTPRSFRIAIVDCYWLTKGENVVTNERYGNYMFNSDRRVVERVFERHIQEDGYSVTHIPLAFIERRD